MHTARTAVLVLLALALTCAAGCAALDAIAGVEDPKRAPLSAPGFEADRQHVAAGAGTANQISDRLLLELDPESNTAKVIGVARTAGEVVSTVSTELEGAVREDGTFDVEQGARALGAGISLINPLAGTLTVMGVPLLLSLYRNFRQWQHAKRREDELSKLARANDEVSIVADEMQAALRETVRGVERIKPKLGPNELTALKATLAEVQNDTTKVRIDELRRKVG